MKGTKVRDGVRARMRQHRQRFAGRAPRWRQRAVPERSTRSDAWTGRRSTSQTNTVGQWRPRRSRGGGTVDRSGRMGALNRGNIVPPRRIESACPPGLAPCKARSTCRPGDETRSCACPDRCSFTRHDIEWSRGALYDYRSLRASPWRGCVPSRIPIAELFYWSSVEGGGRRWNLGRVKRHTVESAHEIV